MMLPFFPAGLTRCKRMAVRSVPRKPRAPNEAQGQHTVKSAVGLTSGGGDERSRRSEGTRGMAPGAEEVKRAGEDVALAAELSPASDKSTSRTPCWMTSRVTSAGASIRLRETPSSKRCRRHPVLR